MAKLFYKDKPIIGLDISQTGMKIMSIDRKKWVVTGYGSIDLDPAKVQQSLDTGDGYLTNNMTELVGKNLVGKLNSDHVVLGIPAGRTFTRTFTVPVKSLKQLKEAVELEVEQYIPIPMSALYVYRCRFCSSKLKEPPTGSPVFSMRMFSRRRMYS